MINTKIIGPLFYPLYAMFCLLSGSLMWASGTPPLTILLVLTFMTLPQFIRKWVERRHSDRVAAARKAAGRVDGVMRPLLRDIGIAVLGSLACLGMVAWAICDC